MPEALAFAPANVDTVQGEQEKPDAALFPTPSRRRDIDDWLTEALQIASSAIIKGPVVNSRTFNDYTAMLNGYDFSTPRHAEDVLAWVVGEMIHGVVHVNHPRYFGLFNPAPTHPAQCAERIASTFNPQLATATTSPFPVALEAHVIRAIASRAGLPASTAGHFTSGGSEANATALICALTQADARFATDGARTFAGQPRVYTSRDAHLAWLKIAHAAGIGRAAVCLVPTDGHGRMDAGCLQLAIDRDLGLGRVPIMIASTAGTTNAGMIDPLDACSRIARKFGVWHHVDAAWGGALVCSDKHKHTLAGIERADSVTIDAHKWLATTMGCGMILVRHHLALERAFHVIMDCMPSNIPSSDPYVTTSQWSRRFLGLRLFVGLAQSGWNGYGAHVEKAIATASFLEQSLVQDGWTKLNTSNLAVLCMRPPNRKCPRRLVEAVLGTGVAWFSAADFEGELAIRFCITSGETSLQDIKQLCDMLRQHCI